MKPFGFVTKSGRFVRQDLFDSYALKEDRTRKLPADVFAEVYGTRGLVQPLYNPEALARALELNTYHYRACRTKARDTAGLGWKLSPLKNKPAEAQKTAVEGFFKAQSILITIMLDRVMMDFESVGYAAMELVREGYRHDGKPVLLNHVPSHTMRIHKDGNKLCQIRGTKERWFKAVGYAKDVDMYTGQEKEPGAIPDERRATEIVWLVNYTPRSDFYGLPDHIPALGAMHGDVARRDYNIAFFDNFGVPAYAVLVTGNFDPGPVGEDGKSELERAIEEHFTTLAKNPHSTLILTIPTADPENKINIHFQPLAVEVKEASFRLYRKDNRDEILAAHGVPPYRMGIAEIGSLAGSTAAESTEIYKASIIEPRQDIIEQLINKWILGQDTDKGLGVTDWWWELNEIDTTDEKHDMEMIEKIFAMGGVSPNGIARYFADRFGLQEEDHPALNARYVNNQAVTLERGAVNPDEVMDALKCMRDKLVDIALKDVGDGSLSDLLEDW